MGETKLEPKRWSKIQISAKSKQYDKPLCWIINISDKTSKTTAAETIIGMLMVIRNNACVHMKICQSWEVLMIVTWPNFHFDQRNGLAKIRLLLQIFTAFFHYISFSLFEKKSHIQLLSISDWFDFFYSFLWLADFSKHWTYFVSMSCSECSYDITRQSIGL